MPDPNRVVEKGRNRILATDIKLLDGILDIQIEFNEGLNLISGENGTLKSRVLGSIRSAGGIQFVDVGRTIPPQVEMMIRDGFNEVKGGFARVVKTDKLPLEIALINPKRNAQRLAVEEMIHEMRADQIGNRVRDALARSSADYGYADYPGLGQLFYQMFQRRARDGADQRSHMERVAAELDGIIRGVFEGYAFSAIWDRERGAPVPELRKNGVLIPLEALSLGEGEVLSLVAFLHYTAPDLDVVLIDEPEVHLNWDLEARLFDFLNRLSERAQTQLIVVTHSRGVFRPAMLEKTQFLFWEGGHIKVTREPKARVLERLTWEATEVIRLGAELQRPTFFVEDEGHRGVVEALSRVFSTEVSVVVAENSSNVKALFRLTLQDRWHNAYFLIDGDGAKRPYFPGEPSFIQLDRYSIQNYFLDPQLASDATGKTREEVQEALTAAVKSKRSALLGQKAAGLAFLLDVLAPEQLTGEALRDLDASAFTVEFMKNLGVGWDEYMTAYITRAHERGCLNDVMPQALLQALSIPAPLPR